MKERKSGIYAITCEINGRKYIGSAVDLEDRKTSHFELLNLGRHTNPSIQVDFNIFGPNQFHYDILEELIDTRDLIKREQYWINLTKNCYNTHKILFKPLPIPTKLDIQRFWSRVTKTEDCWIWRNNEVKYRPRFFYAKKNYMAYRVAYKIEYGDFDDSLAICHKCDNPMCIRPDHLFLGTYADNARDRADKGRGGTSKLSKELAKQIREDYILLPIKNSKYLKEIIKTKYNINLSKNSINMLLRNEIYYDENFKVEQYCDSKRYVRSGEQHVSSTINLEIVNFIRCQYNIGFKWQEIRDNIKTRFDRELSYALIKQVYSNITWKNPNYIYIPKNIK